MSFFDQAYDDMSWEEVCYRLPGELAISALKRRITNLDTLKMFFEGTGRQPNSVKELKRHINSIVANEDPEDILDTFDEKYEKVLFDWLDDDNKDRIKNHDAEKLSTKFLFNSTKSDDREGLQLIMDRVLQEDPVNNTHIRAVLNKSDSDHLGILLDRILKDSRPEVRVSVLGICGLTNKSLLSDHHKVIGLKALAKCNSYNPVATIGIMNIDVFANLRPDERLTALEKYFSYFPAYEKVPAFDPMPSEDEFNLILFAGCIEHNDRVVKLVETYKRITELDPLEVEDEEE